MILRIGLAVLLAAAVSLAVWFGIRSAGQAQTIARLEGELVAARSAARVPPPPAQQPPDAEPGVTRPPHVHPSAKKLELPPRDTSAPLRTQLDQLTTELTAAQARSADLQLRLDALTAENTRLAAVEAEAKEQIAELRSALESGNAERAALDKKVRALDTEVQTLLQQSRSATQKNEELTKSAAELQDVLRRQQTYVNNVVSRYREITDILRTPAAPAGSRDLGPDLVRAGTLISMTDEDLRAVRELNTRLALIQKRILAVSRR